jgi:hypothetical protein
VEPKSENGVLIWKGWNFISVPMTLKDGNDTAGVVFAGVQTGGKPIWFYNSDRKKWEMLSSKTELNTLEAYWIYSTQDGPFVEYRYETDLGKRVPRKKTLEPGWNAIGLGSIYPMPTEQYLSSLGNDWTVLLEYENSLQKYLPPQSSAQAGTMYPTRGYWIFMKDEGELLEVTG